MLPLYYFEVSVNETKQEGFVRAARGEADARKILLSHLGSSVTVLALRKSKYRTINGVKPLMLSRKASAEPKPKPTPINSVVASLFEQVEPELRNGRRAAYRSVADRNMKVWLQRLSSEIPFPEPQAGEPYYEFESRKANFATPPQYVRCQSGILRSNWSEVVKSQEHDGWYADHERADRDADIEVDAIKAAFLRKFTDKLNSAVGGRGDLNPLAGSVRLRAGFVEGVLHAKFENGDQFSLEMDCIINYRHDSHRGAQYGFYQYPSRFKNVMLKGKLLGKVSEKWMKDNFSGTPEIL